MRKARIWDARQLPAFLTPKEYGALMNIDPKTVQTMCRKGLLPAHKEGPRLWRIDKNAALAWQREFQEERPAGAGTPTSQITIGDKTYQVEYTTTKAKIPV